MPALLPEEISERHKAEWPLDLLSQEEMCVAMSALAQIFALVNPEHHTLLLRQITELIDAAHTYADELAAKDMKPS